MSTSSLLPAAAEPASLTPADLGVGARFTVAVMSDDFEAIILDALRGAGAADLEIETDRVSTLVRGSEQRVLEYVLQVIAGAARSGSHVSATLLLSRGCPGEVTCETSPGLLDAAAAVPALRASGIRATAHWSLYPLDDTGRPGETPDHMRDIFAAIDHAKELGTYAGPEHYATRLEGDLADVLATVAAGWVLVGRRVQHVTTHATLSIASPTEV